MKCARETKQYWAKTRRRDTESIQAIHSMIIVAPSPRVFVLILRFLLSNSFLTVSWDRSFIVCPQTERLCSIDQVKPGCSRFVASRKHLMAFSFEAHDIHKKTTATAIHHNTTGTIGGGWDSQFYGTITTIRRQKCGRHILPANSSDITVIHRASTNMMYEKPTWWEFGSWYGWPPISSMWKPSGKMTAAKQNSTTASQNSTNNETTNNNFLIRFFD